MNNAPEAYDTDNSQNISKLSVASVIITTLMAVPFFLFFSVLFWATLQRDNFMGESTYSDSPSNRIWGLGLALVVMFLCITLPVFSSRMFLPRRMQVWLPLSIVVVWGAILVGVFGFM